MDRPALQLTCQKKYIGIEEYTYPGFDMRLPLRLWLFGIYCQITDLSFSVFMCERYCLVKSLPCVRISHCPVHHALIHTGKIIASCLLKW